jgi:hypothetical protein
MDAARRSEPRGQTEGRLHYAAEELAALRRVGAHRVKMTFQPFGAAAASRTILAILAGIYAFIREAHRAAVFSCQRQSLGRPLSTLERARVGFACVPEGLRFR